MLTLENIHNIFYTYLCLKLERFDIFRHTCHMKQIYLHWKTFIIFSTLTSVWSWNVSTCLDIALTLLLDNHVDKLLKTNIFRSDNSSYIVSILEKNSIFRHESVTFTLYEKDVTTGMPWYRICYFMRHLFKWKHVAPFLQW